MAQKKRNPYERAQRQFVQKRAEEKGYDEMSMDQREQLRNRFQQLSQTKRGRTTPTQRRSSAKSSSSALHRTFRAAALVNLRRLPSPTRP